MKIHPAGHRVLVRLKNERINEEKTDSGIIVKIKDAKTVEAEQYATQEAIIEELGINAYKAFDSGEPWCKVGDTVLIAKYSGENREDPESGVIYRVINDEDVIAILED